MEHGRMRVSEIEKRVCHTMTLHVYMYTSALSPVECMFLYMDMKSVIPPSSSPMAKYVKKTELTIQIGVQ